MKRHKEEGVITEEEFKQEIDREAKRLFGKKPYSAEEPLPEELAEAELHQAKKEREERERWEAFLGEPKEAAKEKPEEEILELTEEVEEEPKEKVAEKPKEQILEEARQSFARLDLEAERYVKAQKKLGQQKSKDDFEGYQEAKAVYLEALKDQRVKMYEEAVREIEKLGLAEKEANQEFKKKLEEIIRESIVREANRLCELKSFLRLETKGALSKIEKIKNFVGKVIERYRRMPLSKKLMISGGLFAGGVVAGAAGGATGAALVTGLVAGRWFQRSLAGAATAVGLEGLIKRSQEKQAEKKTLIELADQLEESIKNNDKKLDEKLFQLERSKKKQKFWRYTLAGTAGALIGSGLVGRALANVAEGIWKPEEVERMVPPGAAKEMPKMPSAEPSSPISEVPAGEMKVAGMMEGIETKAPADFIETAQKGDSIWKMAKDQLVKHYGEKFASLDQARKTYIIDAIKDKVAANPKAFDLADIDKIKVGQKIDFSSIFADKDEIEKIFNQATALKEAALENIEKNNQLLAEWIKEHPGEELTSAKTDEILAEISEKTASEEVIMPGDQEALQKAELTTLVSEKAEAFVRALGFTPEEYKAIQDLKVEELLEQIPSKYEAWEIWRGEIPDRTIDLPHHGVYGFSEFNKHIKLAEFIRSYHSGEELKKLTIKEFLRILATTKE
jgi:hypothetical protein